MEKSNAGFDALIGFQYIFEDQVESIWPGLNGIVSVTPKAGCNWIDLYFTPGKSSWSQKSNNERRGRLWVQKCSVTCPKENELNWTELSLLGTRKVFVKLRFNGGDRLIGSRGNPVLLTVEDSDSSGLEVTVSFEKLSEEKARWIK